MKIFRLLNKKLVFCKPGNYPIILFDKGGKVFEDHFDQKKIHYLDLSKQFNFYIFLKVLFKYKYFNLFNYFLEYINIVNPKIIITYIDNNVIFYKLKFFFPKKIFLAVQNGTRNKFFFDKLKRENKLKCDYIFTWGRAISYQYKKYIECKTKVLGSFKNNRENNNYFKVKRKSIAVIGTKFHKKNEKKYISKPKYFISSKVFHASDLKLLPILYKICKNLNYKLEIISKGNNDIELEKEFYKKVLKSNDFIFHGYNKNIYKISDEVELCINTTSSFGLESLSRGNKTCFFNVRKNSEILKHLDVFWPLKIEDTGPFWTNRLNFKQINEIINSSIKISSANWKRKIKKIVPDLIVYNKNNYLFQKIVKKYL